MRHWQADPSDEEETAREAWAEEDAREQRWAEFVLDCSRLGHARMAFRAGLLYKYHNDIDATFSAGDEKLIIDFQATEGWSGVFAALARAIKEHEALPDDAEMERRR